MMTMERLTALDFLAARQAMKTPREIRLEASALRSEANYLAILCGPDDSEWLQTAERMGAAAFPGKHTADPAFQIELWQVGSANF